MTDSERCVTCRQVAEPPEVCCSAHGLVLCHACYRRTHSVEVLCSGSESPNDDRTTSGPVVSVVADAAEVARLTAENELLERINANLVRDFNAMLRANARAESQRDALSAVIADEALIRRAIFDPGQFLPRGDNYTEPITSWCARAVVAALADGLAAPVGETPDEDVRCGEVIAGLYGAATYCQRPPHTDEHTANDGLGRTPTDPIRYLAGPALPVKEQRGPCRCEGGCERSADPGERLCGSCQSGGCHEVGEQR